VSTGWESRAEQWLAWARTPGFDAYWSYRDAFFALMPPPDDATLEVGCGEGRVTRDLAERGHRVTALDASPTLLGAAAQLDPGGEYVLGTAEALPFADASFTLVVAYNVLIDVEDMPAAVREAARVLAPFVIEGSYRGARRFEMAIERGGLEMTFDGMIYALEDYARALEAAGLAIEAIREPGPAGDAAERPDAAEWARWRRIPMFLMLRARKPDD
jgi:SAM-dependent methyltransferase